MCICESSTHNIREKNSILIQGYRGEISFQYLPKLVFCSRGRLKVVFLNVQCICNWLYLCSSTVLDTWVLLYDVVDLWHIGKKNILLTHKSRTEKSVLTLIYIIIYNNCALFKDHFVEIEMAGISASLLLKIMCSMCYSAYSKIAHIQKNTAFAAFPRSMSS